MTALLDKPIKNHMVKYVCLYFLSIFITPAVLIILDKGETYEPGEVPFYGFFFAVESRLDRILFTGPIKVLENFKREGQKIITVPLDPDGIELYRKRYYTHTYKSPETWGFIEPSAHGGFYDDDRSIKWKVHKLPENRKRIEINTSDDGGWRYYFINIKDNQVSSARKKIGLHRGHAIGAPLYGFFLPIFVYMVCIVYLIIKELYRIYFGVHRYTVDSNR